MIILTGEQVDSTNWIIDSTRNFTATKVVKRDLKSRFKRDKTMADKLMYIFNDDTQNYRFQLVIEMFGRPT